MTKVIQIRDVPDDVRDALAAAASAEGLSLAGYVRRELEQIAGRSRRAGANAAALRRTQSAVGEAVGRKTILDVLDDGRAR